MGHKGDAQLGELAGAADWVDDSAPAPSSYQRKVSHNFEHTLATLNNSTLLSQRKQTTNFTYANPIADPTGISAAKRARSSRAVTSSAEINHKVSTYCKLDH